jgi:hypothetical protein
MPLQADKKTKVWPFGDFSGGLNLNDPAIALPENQIPTCRNVMLLKKGFKRWHGAVNLTTKDACTDVFRGEWIHREISGTEHLFTMFGGVLYEVNQTTGALTSLSTLTGTGQAESGSAFGTFFVSNGAAVVKVEGSTAYQVGISAPVGDITAVAVAGGTLAAGVYKIKVCYARKVAGLNVLYGVGLDTTANVTLAGSPGNSTVAISGIPDSTDPQVNNKVVFMTLAGGSTYYQFAETGDNTTTSINISSDTSNNAIIYDTSAATNYLPGMFEHLLVFDNRVWGSIGNILYYSQKGYSKYDLEKFPVLNRIEYPYQITGLFSLGADLHINTAANGVFTQPNADIGAQYLHTEQRYSFKYMNTVADWNGMKIGVTNDGLQLFNGTNFLEWDLAADIRPAMERMRANATADNGPCGFVYRRDNRIEYQLSFMDAAVSGTVNNQTYVLNLSQSVYTDNVTYRAPWELLWRGFNYVAVNGDNTPYYAQSFAGSSQIYKENLSHTTEQGIYSAEGTYLTAATDMLASLDTRIVFANLFALMIVEDSRILLQLAHAAQLAVSFVDDPSRLTSQTTDLDDSSSSQWGAFYWDTDSWSIESPMVARVKPGDGMWGYTMQLQFSQTADDIDMNVVEFDVQTTLETGRAI